MELKIFSEDLRTEEILKEIVGWSNIGFERAFQKHKEVPLITTNYKKTKDCYILSLTIDEKAFPFGYGKLWKRQVKKELRKSFKKKGIDVRVE